MGMTGFERWQMKRIIRRQVIQGHGHAKNIEALYAMIRTACEEEFTEDNAATMDGFLRERFQTTQRLGSDPAEQVRYGDDSQEPTFETSACSDCGEQFRVIGLDRDLPPAPVCAKCWGKRRDYYERTGDYPDPLEARKARQALGMTCPSCSGSGPILDGFESVRECEVCGGLYGRASREEALRLVYFDKQILETPNPGGIQYFDLDVHTEGRGRVHGWFDPKTRRVLRYGRVGDKTGYQLGPPLTMFQQTMAFCKTPEDAIKALVERFGAAKVAGMISDQKWWENFDGRRKG